jgi:hypothetical protein
MEEEASVEPVRTLWADGVEEERVRSVRALNAAATAPEVWMIGNKEKRTSSCYN